MRFAAVGLDHRHIYHMVGELIEAGAECAGFDPATSDPRVLDGFRQRFPDLKPRSADALIDDPTIDLVAIAAVPRNRATLAAQAMRAGKDVMVDKPGVTSLADLASVKAACRETGRIFSVCFSERFIVPATIVAEKLIADGAIGRVVQTIGMGPHRLNRAIRPAWFFDPANYGGILNDIASHQIDQFLYFTGSKDAEIVAASVGHFGGDHLSEFQDFGEVLLRSDRACGYVRVDWFTADGLPTWGDGRLTILGTDGFIEVRKNVDIAGRTGGSHLFLVDQKETKYIESASTDLPYGKNLVDDILNRTETAMPQKHVFLAMELALIAEKNAQRIST